jgi:hypothetical protein
MLGKFTKSRLKNTLHTSGSISCTSSTLVKRIQIYPSPKGVFKLIALLNSLSDRKQFSENKPPGK